MTMDIPPPQVSLLHRVSSIVASERSLDEMLGEMVGLAVQVTQCDACLVYLFEKETNEIVLCASQVPHAAELGNLRMKIGEGITGWVAEHKSAVVLSEHPGRTNGLRSSAVWWRTPTNPSFRSRS